jgi:hypothetical protein
MPALGIVDDVAQIFEIGFQHVERAEPVERLHRVISVADPAVAIVPVALRIGMFGDRGGERGDDRAGFLVLAEFERDRRADHDILPFERRGQPPHPFGAIHARSGRACRPACRRMSPTKLSSGPRKKWSGRSTRNSRSFSSQPIGAVVLSRSVMSLRSSGYGSIRASVAASAPPQSQAGATARESRGLPADRADDAREGDRPVHAPVRGRSAGRNRSPRSRCRRHRYDG